MEGDAGSMGWNGRSKLSVNFSDRVYINHKAYVISLITYSGDNTSLHLQTERCMQSLSVSHCLKYEGLPVHNSLEEKRGSKERTGEVHCKEEEEREEG